MVDPHSPLGLSELPHSMGDNHSLATQVKEGMR